jgi:hypothetical protein
MSKSKKWAKQQTLEEWVEELDQEVGCLDRTEEGQRWVGEKHNVEATRRGLTLQLRITIVSVSGELSDDDES